MAKYFCSLGLYHTILYYLLALQHLQDIDGTQSAIDGTEKKIQVPRQLPL